MIEPYERIFSNWYQERSTSTGNWSFDIEEAAKESFQVGIRVGYEPIKEIMFDVARVMNIKVMQKRDDNKFIAMLEGEDDSTKGTLGQSAPEAIYGLVKALSRGEKFTKVEDLNEDERDTLGIT